MEEAFGATVFCDVATGQISVPEILGDDGSAGMAPIGLLPPIYRVFLMDNDIASHQRHIRRFRSLATKPYHQVRTKADAWEEEIESNLGGPLTALLLPALSSAAEAAAKGDARRRIAEVAIAALRHRARDGRLPNTADELVPDFLRYVPKDPFDGLPLKVKRTSGGAIIYSVGSDGVDDDGQPLADESKRGDVVFTLSNE